MEEVVKKADIFEGIVDGENLTNLKFADDVALFNEKTNKNKKQKRKKNKKRKQSERRKS